MRGKAGFTLLEALATLGISALTLSLMYTVGMRGAFTGFRLGNRAIASADTEIAKAAYREVLAGIVVPPVAVQNQIAETELTDRLDDTFIGTSTEVSGHLIAGRDTPCALAGTDARITLTYETDEASTTVFCAIDEGLGDGLGEPIELMRLRFGNAYFSFSEDGATWVDEWTVERGLPVETQLLPNGELRKVLVRLSSDDGSTEVLGLVSSGRAIAATAPVPQAQGGGGGRGGGGDGGRGDGGRGGPDGGGRGGDGFGGGGRGGFGGPPQPGFGGFGGPPGGGRGGPGGGGGGGRGGRG